MGISLFSLIRDFNLQIFSAWFLKDYLHKLHHWFLPFVFNVKHLLIHFNPLWIQVAIAHIIWNKIGVLQQVMVFFQAINTPFPADVLNNTWFCDFRTVSPESRTDRMGRVWKKKIIQKRPFNCSWWPNTKLLWGLKFPAEKNHVLKTEEKSKITRIVSVRIFALFCRKALRVPLRYVSELTKYIGVIIQRDCYIRFWYKTFP